MGKTVVLVGSFAPSLINFRGHLISSIVKRGHRLIAVAPSISPTVAQQLQALGAEVREISLVNTSLNPIGLIRAVRDLRQLIRADRPDVLVAYTIKPVILAAFAGSSERVDKIMVLITGVGYAFTSGHEVKRIVSRFAAAALFRVALAKCHKIVFQNPDDEALFRTLRLVRKQQTTQRVNGSGVDLRRFMPVALPNKPSFLMIARLLNDKGAREFAEAARRLKTEYPDLHIALVGRMDASPDSLSADALRKLIDAGIDFKGELADVRPAIAGCSVYVLPSYREGTPRSVLEAMAMGRPIITTNAPGCRETVREGVNGFMVPPRNADALYAAMLRFVHEPELIGKMGKRSRQLAEEKFDVRRISAELLSIAEL